MNIKIVSWNVNGIRAGFRKGLLGYLEKEKPDIFCIQETKARPEQLTPEQLEPLDYKSYFHSCSIKKGYSGVSIYTRLPFESVSTGFGIEKFDQEGRVIQMDFKEFSILNIYFPNGQRDGARLDYKLEFYKELFDYCESLRNKGKKLIVCGDYNTAHNEIDLARPKQNTKISGFMPIEREWIDKIISQGYIDSFRVFNSEPENYTWWSMQTKARERNVGWRIDYHFITEDLKNNLKNANIRSDIMGSDHCPVEIELMF